MGKHISIEHGTFRLEAVHQKNNRPDAVVITHPHPLYGGNMENPVVKTIEQAFYENGVATLRFNFRGTGKSTGQFDDGVGEQADVKAAVEFLEKEGYGRIRLAGYSFGSRINAAVVSGGCRVTDHIMVSPPVAFMPFDDIPSLRNTGLVITGSDDEIAPKALIETHLDRWGIDPVFETIPDCDHFYSGCLDRLGIILDKYLAGELTG